MARVSGEEIEIWDFRTGISGHRREVNWITQAALGALIGELIMGKRLGKRALAWGALLGILPELDVVVFPFLDTAGKLVWHQGASHSLVVMGAAAYGLAHGLAKIWRKEKITKPQAGGLVAAVWGAHVLAECLTVAGAAVLWPLVGKRVAFESLPPGDLLLAGPLVAAALWMAFLPEEPQKKPRGKKVVATSKRRKLCLRGLGLSAGYALIAIGMKFVASAGFEADLARRGVKYERRMESPTPYDILLWRAVVDSGDEFRVGYRTIFELPETPVRWTIYPKGKDALAAVAEIPATQSLAKWTDGWWLARPNAQGAWLGDLRFPESRIWGSKKDMVDSRLAFSWVIRKTEKGDPLRQISQEGGYGGDYLPRMGARISGNRGSWEANPRLAGVTGSLPEFLGVDE